MTNGAIIDDKQASNQSMKVYIYELGYTQSKDLFGTNLRQLRLITSYVQIYMVFCCFIPRSEILMENSTLGL